MITKQVTANYYEQLEKNKLDKSNVSKTKKKEKSLN
jgi:hypothetical protein